MSQNNCVKSGRLFFPEPDAEEVLPELVSDVRAMFPKIWVGKLTDPPVEGQFRVFATATPCGSSATTPTPTAAPATGRNCSG